ncbi:filamentous hemagglutinin N-terminal domain-containing protein [Sinorhizobium medicae]|uniref:YDG domain-containing protein n=1 Tax=Sinorhizobium medicae TaxID=110321 RepID=UPI000FD8F6EE|nr:YDG domain-containing protein [Sinorhizobium medicae]RVP73058.1 filamentous hemagglutinin N-terminal domain-containing protein [Sinorhizobium medicae]
MKDRLSERDDRPGFCISGAGGLPGAGGLFGAGRLRGGLSALVLGTVLSGGFVESVSGNPLDGHVVSGSASIGSDGTVMTVTQGTDRAVIDWRSFSIGAGETTRFVQPSASSVTANRVTGGDPSSVLGSLKANGTVVLVNRNGIVFGTDARVDAGGLVATVHDLDTAGFMSGSDVLRFEGGARPGASVVNHGTISVRDAGLAAFVAPHVRNEGVITADFGRVALASAKGFSVDLYGDGLLSFAPGDGLEETIGDGAEALVQNGGTLAGSRVLLTAHAAREVVNASVNVSGLVRATSVSSRGGVITLGGSGSVRVSGRGRLDASGSGGGGRVTIKAGPFSTDGTIDVRGVDASGAAVARGGIVEITADGVMLGGEITASGASGGGVDVASRGVLSLAGRVEAQGLLGSGGSIGYRGRRVVETGTGSTSVSGLTHGGTISVMADQSIATSGSYAAGGVYGKGGRIDMSAPDVRLLSAGLEARGRQQGGLVRVGGGFQGGKTADTKTVYYDSFVGRWGALAGLGASSSTFVNDATAIDVSAWQGAGGTAVVWSDDRTTFLGGIDARGTAGGGSVEISSAGDLRRAGLANVKIGEGGHLLLDPKNIIIGTPATVSGWAYQAIIGAGYGKNRNVIALGANDGFGLSVSLNAAGDRLAVGAYQDDGSSGNVSNSGAVYLFSFTDTTFSGGMLEAVIGKDYTGGKNVDVGALGADDGFGASVSLNAAGDRLAAGAYQDDGSGGNVSNSGAVYLFSFTDTTFSNGSLEAVLGKGYTGGKNVDVAALAREDQFGVSVSLNASGDRLAVAADLDDGSGKNVSKSGAVYLFSFTDTTFSNGTLEAVLGKGYTDGKNVDVAALAPDDQFGISVSLNAAGNRLAVGAIGDNGSGGTSVSRAGAVYLFSFTDAAFSGGTLEAVLGKGYTGGKNVDVVALGATDFFGRSVSLNAKGDRLAAGANLDDGSGNQVSNSGAVYLFSFTNAEFSGGSIEAVIGKGYTGGKNVDVATLEVLDAFGSSVSLNADGDLLAVGPFLDDGSGNGVRDSGAVYLFSFTDTKFSGGLLEAVIGKGYSNGKNVNVDALGVNDGFGGSVSLNGAGDRLAVGANLDDGFGNRVKDSGAVYLFSFTDAAFSGGTLEAVIGKGYTGGKNVDVAALENDDWFGHSVSLNASGDRLAVGANLDDGFGNGVKDSGAVYLFSFTDAAFSGGGLKAVIGRGYDNTTGDKNVDVAALESDDRFGSSVSLNAAGDRLAVGAPGDGSVVEAGAAYLFSFTDRAFSDGAPELVIDKDYPGFNGAALEEADRFGSSVSLNAAGDRLAVGAPGDDGHDTSPIIEDNNFGAVYLFSFTDTAFSDSTHEAVIGNGYSGGKNVDIATLEDGDTFGSSVSLNASGNRLAVGALGGNGANNIDDSGAAYLFRFTDTAFSGGTQEAVIGNGYSGANNVDVSLEEDDKFGSSVSLNALGNLLAIGAPLDDGAGNRVSDSGAVYLFAGILDGDSVSSANYGDDPSADSYILPSDIVSLLSAGTNVTLQANNDITVAEAVAVTDGSARLTLQAGLIDAGITSNGGDVTLIANDLLENGVVDAHRDSGAAVITMAPGTVLDAGTGAVIFDLRAGTGKTKRQGGDITVGTVNAGSILAVNAGPNGKSGIVLGSGSVLTASATGNAIVLAGDRFTNRSGASPLQASGGRWLVWSGNPADDTRGGLSYGFKQYNAKYGETAVAQGAGNGFLYSLAPKITVGLTGTVSKAYDGTTGAVLAGGNYTVSGAVDGDTVSITQTAGSYDTKHVGTGKTVTASLADSHLSAVNGTVKVYGYKTVNMSAAGPVGEITARALTVSTEAVSKVYDGTVSASGTAIVTSGALKGSDTLSGGSFAFADKHAGAGKTVTVSDVTIDDGNSGGNYILTYADNTASEITARALTVSTKAVSRVYDGTVSASGTAIVTSGALQGSDTLSGGSFAFADKHAGAGKTVTVSDVTLNDGNSGGNYILTYADNTASEITARVLTVSLSGTVSKVYDGATAATLSPGNYSLSGLVPGDVVSIVLLSSNYDTADIGTGKTVSVAGLSLSGVDKANYLLGSSAASAAIGEITSAVTPWDDSVKQVVEPLFDQEESGKPDRVSLDETLGIRTGNRLDSGAGLLVNCMEPEGRVLKLVGSPVDVTGWQVATCMSGSL